MKPVGAAVVMLAFLGSCQASTSKAVASPGAPRSCARPVGTALGVELAIKAFYGALAKDDRQAFDRVTSENFYAFEIGKRYSGPQLFDLIADAHKSGRAYEWNVGVIDSHVDCNLASAAWENRGASGIPGKMEPRAWLESAVLVREDGRWVIVLLHSTPKNPKP